MDGLPDWWDASEEEDDAAAEAPEILEAEGGSHGSEFDHHQQEVRVNRHMHEHTKTCMKGPHGKAGCRLYVRLSACQCAACVSDDGDSLPSTALHRQAEEGINYLEVVEVNRRSTLHRCKFHTHARSTLPQREAPAPLVA